jgi:hypothetical protein
VQILKISAIILYNHKVGKSSVEKAGLLFLLPPFLCSSCLGCYLATGFDAAGFAPNPSFP